MWEGEVREGKREADPRAMGNGGGNMGSAPGARSIPFQPFHA